MKSLRNYDLIMVFALVGLWFVVSFNRQPEVLVTAEINEQLSLSLHSRVSGCENWGKLGALCSSLGW